MPDRTKTGQFVAGHGIKGGRPKGSRHKALESIFKIFNEDVEGFERDLRMMRQKDRIKFYKEFVFPLMPRELNIESTSHKMLSIEYSNGKITHYGTSDAFQAAQIPGASVN